MFAQVIALAPDSFRGYSNLGAAYVELSRYEEAISALEHSITIRPSASGYSNLGNAYFYLHRYEEADYAYEQAVRPRRKGTRVFGGISAMATLGTKRNTTNPWLRIVKRSQLPRKGPRQSE